jgi:hypothetical protein
MIFASVVLTVMAACSQLKTEPVSKFTNPCDQLQNDIKQARYISSELEHYDWSEFSGIGILCPPQGICPVGNLPIVEKAAVDEELLSRVVSLPDRLPSPATAKNYSLQCNSCLRLASKVCSDVPYVEAAGTDNKTEELQALCLQLQSALQAAEYLSTRDKTIAVDYTFPKLLAYFTASEATVKQKYMAKFTAKTDEYIKLQDEMIRNLQEAKQVTVDLYNLKFTPSAATTP